MIREKEKEFICSNLKISISVNGKRIAYMAKEYMCFDLVNLTLGI